MRVSKGENDVITGVAVDVKGRRAGLQVASTWQTSGLEVKLKRI